MYVDLWEKLVKHYENKLDAVVAACAKEKPGGGSGGHQDRVECVTKRYEEEGKRVKRPKQWRGSKTSRIWQIEMPLPEFAFRSAVGSS